MPGQYYDQETGTFYNYFRDYDPTIGRYIQSDPIGLVAGTNTYIYVDGKPLTTFDLRGLRGFDEPAGGGGDSPPSNPYGLCSDNDCPFPMKLFHRGICDNQPGTCASSMHAAGISGPYFGHTGTYSKSCLLLLGLGFKATSSVALTVGLNRAAGAGIPGAAGAAAIGNNPVVIGVGAAFALDALFEHCKCKG